MSDHQEQLHEELEHIRVALDQMASDARQLASEARGPSPRAPSTGPAPSDRDIQVIVEIEARAVTVERLSMVSERQGWTFGETLEYALDALELVMAKTVRIPSDPCARARRDGSHAHAHPNRLPQLRAYRRCQRRVPSARADLLTMQSWRVHQERQTGGVPERCTRRTASPARCLGAV